jgi:cell division septum initiation protein DivIVA
VILIDILHLVDRLDNLLSESFRIPFSSNVVVHEHAFLDIIDQMRISIPEEVRQARRTEAERERVLAQAREEADRLMSMAREQINSLAEDDEIVQAAHARAVQIISETEEEAGKIQTDADQYVIDQLSTLEEQLLMLLTTVRNGLHQVQDMRKSSMAPESSPEAEIESSQS